MEDLAQASKIETGAGGFGLRPVGPRALVRLARRSCASGCRPSLPTRFPSARRAARATKIAGAQKSNISKRRTDVRPAIFANASLRPWPALPANVTHRHRDASSANAAFPPCTALAARASRTLPDVRVDHPTLFFLLTMQPLARRAAKCVARFVILKITALKQRAVTAVIHTAHRWNVCDDASLLARRGLLAVRITRIGHHMNRCSRPTRICCAASAIGCKLRLSVASSLTCCVTINACSASTTVCTF